MHSCTRREEVDQAQLLENYKKLFDDTSLDDVAFYPQVLKLQLQMTLETKKIAMAWHEASLAEYEAK